MTTVDRALVSPRGSAEESGVAAGSGDHAAVTSTPPERHPVSRPSWERVAIAVGLSGVLVYGLYYGAYSTFYAAFGLTPEDVGISWPQAFGRMSVAPVAVVAAMSGPALVLLLFVALVGLGVLVLLARGRDEVVRRVPAAARLLGPGVAGPVRRWTPPLPAVALAAALYCFDAADAYSQRAERPVVHDGPVAIVLFVLLAWGACALLTKVAGHRMSWVPGGLAALVLIASASIALHSAVREAAVEVRDQGRWSPAALAVGIVPQYVTVDVPDDTGRSTVDDRTMLLLGSTNGVYALFDCRSATVLRIEAQNVALTHDRASTEADLTESVRRCRDA